MLTWKTKKYCSIRLFLMILTVQISQVCLPRIENIKRDSNGAATSVFDDTVSGGEVFITGYPSKFARYDSQTQCQNAIFDDLKQQIYLAEAESSSAGNRSLMVGKIVDGNKIVLSTLTPSGHPLRNKSFQQIGQNSKKIVAVTTDSLSQIHIIDKADPSQIITKTLKDGGDINNGVIDKFLVLEDRIIIGIFQNGKNEYANNLNGRIISLDINSGQITTLSHPTTGNPLIVDTYDLFTDTNHGPNDLTAICGKKSLRKIGSMHWDSDLKRLYIAFSHIDDIDANADVMPFLVCRFDETGKFIAEGLAPLSTATGQKNGIVSFRIENLLGLYNYTVPLMKTLTDNFGRKYLVANINYRDEDHAACRRVFCLPLLCQDAAQSDSEIGKLSKKDFSALPTVQSDFYTASLTNASADSPALVGGANLPVSMRGQISSIMVLGQTVFVSTLGLSGTETSNYRAQESGVWASSAIFDSAGIIMGWSPWTRVAGIAHSVYNVFFDSKNNQFWLHFDLKDNPNQTFNASFGLAKTELGLGNLTENEGGLFKLGKAIEANCKNIVCANHFPAVQSKGLCNVSLSIFGGIEQIFLARTGLSVGAQAGTNDSLEPYRTIPSGFTQNSDPYSNTQVAKLITLPAGQGAVLCSEIARIANVENSGWLFLGTTNGLGVFSKSPGVGGFGDGQGWACASTGPINLDIFQSNPASGSSETAGKLYFRQLYGIADPVIELHARAETTLSSGTRNFLYALTSKNLYRIQISQDKFLASTINRAALNPISIFSTKDNERLISLRLLPDSNCGYLLTSNAQDLDPSLPLRTQGKQRSIKLYLINSIDNVVNRDGFCDVSNQLGEITDIAQIKLITTNIFNTSLIFPTDVNPPIANLLITTGGLSNPTSKIYAIPIFGNLLSDSKAATGLAKKYFQNITKTGNAVLISNIKNNPKDPRLSLGSNLISIPFAYGSSHRQNGSLKEDLVVNINDGSTQSISEKNLRTCNSWVDSATGASVIAGNFGIRIQE